MKNLKLRFLEVSFNASLTCGRWQFSKSGGAVPAGVDTVHGCFIFLILKLFNTNLNEIFSSPIALAPGCSIPSQIREIFCAGADEI
jgi:hypothetical protein